MGVGKGLAAAAAATVVLFIVALAVWARNDDPARSGATPTSPATGAVPTPGAATAAAGGGSESEAARCPASGGRKARTADIPFRADVDGDGQADEVFVGRGEVGVRTAAGVTSSFDITAAKPLSVLGAEDANGDGRDELFIQKSVVDGEEMGAGVLLGVFVNCQLRPLLNEEGDPYVFLVGVSDAPNGSPILRGVGCVTQAGARHLVGLEGRGGGHTVGWSRTIVEIDGNRARNGEVQRGVFERQGPDADAVELLGQASCGEKTFDNPLGN